MQQQDGNDGKSEASAAHSRGLHTPISYSLEAFRFTVQSWLVRGDLSPAGQVTIAAVAALLSILWLPVYPLIRYKAQQPMLTIGPEGITTSIGELSGEVPWKAIDRVEVRDQRLFFVGRCGNAFMIPSAAFRSPEEQQRFAAQATTWWRAQSAA